MTLAPWTRRITHLPNHTQTYCTTIHLRHPWSKVPTALIFFDLFTSFESIGNPTRSLVFFMAITKWLPGLLTWLHDNSSHPGMQNLRQNRDQVRSIARKLLDSKRQELKDGTSTKDIMSLLGLSPLLFPFTWLLKNSSPQLKLAILSARTGD